MSSRKRPIPSEPPDIDSLVKDLIDDPDRWMDAKNDQLGGKKPRDLLGTDREPLLRQLLESMKHGMFS